MQIELFTCGAAITAATAQFLRERAVSVALKINSLNHDLQNQLASDGHDLNATFAAIQFLKKVGYGDPTAPLLAIRIEVCQENLGEIPALWRWIRRQGM